MHDGESIRRVGFDAWSADIKDRLDWKVKCTNDMEYDEYDNNNANYVLGLINNKVICGSRLIDMKQNTMFETIFYSYFEKKK